MIDCDLLDARPIGLFAVLRTQDAAFSKDCVSGFEVPFLDEAENCCGSDWLAYARYTKEIGGCQLLAGIVTRHSESLLIHEATVLGDSNGKPGRIELPPEILGDERHYFPLRLFNFTVRYERRQNNLFAGQTRCTASRATENSLECRSPFHMLMTRQARTRLDADLRRPLGCIARRAERRQPSDLGGTVSALSLDCQQV